MLQPKDKIFFCGLLKCLLGALILCDNAQDHTLSSPIQPCAIALGLRREQAGCHSQAPVLEGGWHRIQAHCGISTWRFTTNTAQHTVRNQIQVYSAVTLEFYEGHKNKLVSLTKD